MRQPIAGGDEHADSPEMFSDDEKPLESERALRTMPAKPGLKAKWLDPNLKVVLDVKAMTKTLVPTRLSEIEQT